jgi:hypothetical protein
MKLLSSTFSLAILTAACLLSACSERTAVPEALALHYFTSSEANYTDIKVEDNQLTYTYFEDSTNRCAQWIKNEPCWQPTDLKTVTAPLDAATEAELRKLIDEQKVLDPAATTLAAASEAAPQERAYTEKLDIRLGAKEQHLIYRSRPDAPPKPEAFEQIEQTLQTAADKVKAAAS